jgi:AsmA-like protein
MGVLGRIFGILLALVVALAIGAYFYLQDANRLKPEIEQLISEQSGYTTRIDGDISWSLFPPLSLNVADVNLSKTDEDITAGTLQLNVDLSAMWNDINQWRVTELTLLDTTYNADGASTLLNKLEVKDFRLSEPAEVFADVVYTSKAGAEPLAARFNGFVTYTPATAAQPQRIILKDGRITSDMATGICQAEATDNPLAPVKPPAEGEDDLLPLATLLSYNFSADCNLSELVVGSETFRDSHVDITNTAGRLNVMLNINDFLGGSLASDVDIDATKPTPLWTILPEVTGVDSQRLIDWTDQRLQWIAPIALNSKLTLRGNTEEQLMASVNAATEFNGGQGQLNISKIKAQLMQIAAVTRQTDRAATWPDVWNYEQFTGRWNIDGALHSLQFALDHMSVDANGEYDYLNDTIDMLANVTVNTAPENNPFTINPLLEGTPIPIRCTGAAADPTCKLDRNAAQTIVAKALQSGDDSGLRKKLEQKIDEEVPEEYRDTARGLLDILGRALDNKE